MSIPVLLLRTLRALFSSPASTSPGQVATLPAPGAKDRPGSPPLGERPGSSLPGTASCVGDERICGQWSPNPGLQNFICVRPPHTDGRHSYVNQVRYLEELWEASRR